MKLLISKQRLLGGAPGPPPRRGAVLMLAMLVLFVLLLIVFQISISTGTDARVSRNEETAKAMDFAIESFLLEAIEMLREDAEGDAAAGDAGAADPMAAMGGGGAEGGEEQTPSDSREDTWAEPQATPLNDVNLRVVIQDEDSKFNILALLTENEDEAEKSFERLVRIIEYSRKGTEEEIDGTDARQMAQVILEYMNRRKDALLPKAPLLSDDEENDDWGLPLSLRELVAVDPDVFTMDHFRDYEDEMGKVVHGLGSFLTVWTSLSTADQTGSAPGSIGAPPAGADPATTGGDPTSSTIASGGDGGATTLPPGGETGQAGVPGAGGTGTGGTESSGGIAVNVNTAPLAVLKGLLDDRDLPFDWWESVLEYRNTIDEEQIDEDIDLDDLPPDEYGNPAPQPLQIFDTLEELSEVDGWHEIEPLFQGELNNLLTTQSNVFSIFVTARKPTGEEQYEAPRSAEERKEQERKAPGLVHTVRCVVWRRAGSDGGVEIVPLQWWEVLDYAPIEVKDFPEEDDR